MIAAQQKKDLCLKGVAFTVGVEIREKGILLENLKKDLGVKGGLQQAGEGRLSDSDDPFDGNIHENAPVVKLTKDTITLRLPSGFQGSGVKSRPAGSCHKKKRKIVLALRDRL
jgi:hypothetical protein